MSSRDSAARNYNSYPEYEDDFGAAPPPRRTQPTGAMPGYRIAGQGGQITRSQAALPQPMPGSMPRPTRANVPMVAPRPTYNDEYARRMERPVAPGRRPAPSGLLSRLNLSGNAGTARLAIMAAGLVAILIVSYLVVSFAVHTWQTWQDDMTYGRPRITRLEASVGHNEIGGNKSLFIAQNIKGQISITEFPGGDPSKTRVILGPNLFGKDKDLVPVKLQVRDINGDNLPDLIASADDMQAIYVNENGTFRPANEQERARARAANQEDNK